MVRQMTTPLWESERTEWISDGGLTVIRRNVFASERFPYKEGEHVVFGGPSTRGKTSLAFDLLPYIVTPDFPAYIAVSKPSDAVTLKRAKELDFRIVSEWPPPRKLGEMLGGKKPSGYVVWPPFGDLNTDMERCAKITATLLEERYARGASPKNTGGILVMDDTMVKAKIMGLDNQMVTILAMAGAMRLGLWIFVQKPTDSGRTTLWGYENATHLFFTKGGDQRMLRRYAEISGDVGPLVMQIIPTLKEFQFLYVHKVKGWICIVDAR
jgi:hypothetical protein